MTFLEDNPELSVHQVLAPGVGRAPIAVADQGGWACHSRSMLGYMRRADGRDDNAATGLA